VLSVLVRQQNCVHNKNEVVSIEKSSYLIFLFTTLSFAKAVTTITA